MSNKGQVAPVHMAGVEGGGMVLSNPTTVSDIIFKEHVNASALQRWKSLFPGLGYAAGYKVLQRTYKFGAQGYDQRRDVGGRGGGGGGVCSFYLFFCLVCCFF
jgi:hypothetical protein